MSTEGLPRETTTQPSHLLGGDWALSVSHTSLTRAAQVKRGAESPVLSAGGACLTPWKGRESKIWQGSCGEPSSRDPSGQGNLCLSAAGERPQ